MGTMGFNRLILRQSASHMRTMYHSTCTRLFDGLTMPVCLENDLRIRLHLVVLGVGLQVVLFGEGGIG